MSGAIATNEAKWSLTFQCVIDYWSTCHNYSPVLSVETGREVSCTLVMLCNKRSIAQMKFNGHLMVSVVLIVLLRKKKQKEKLSSIRGQKQKKQGTRE